MKKKAVITVICIYAALLLAALILVAPFLLRSSISVRDFIDAFLPPPSAEKMERIFNRDQEDLLAIKNYFVDSDYSELRINESSYISHPDMMYAGSDMGYVEFIDIEVFEAIKRLFEQHGYDIISNAEMTS